MSRFYSVLFLILLSASLFSQADEGDGFHKNFKIEELPRILLNELNRFRVEKGLDTLEMNEMMQFAAEISAQNMGNSGKDKIDAKSTGKCLKKAGATKRGEEITMKANIF